MHVFPERYYPAAPAATEAKVACREAAQHVRELDLFV